MNSTEINMELTEVYRNHVMRLYNAGNWFVTPRDFGYIMEREEAHFLSDVLNRASLDATNKLVVMEDDGWSADKKRTYFQCSPKYLESPPYKWDHKTQDRLIRSLEEKKYLKRSPRTGVFQGKRWLWVNMDKIVIDLEIHLSQKNTEGDIFPIGENVGGTFSQSGKIPNGDGKKEDTNVSSNTSKKRNTHSRFAAGAAREEVNGVFKQPKNQEVYQNWVDTLYQAINKKGLLSRNVKTSTWLQWFKKLEEDKIPREEITSTLNWYVSHIGEDFIPEAYCGKSFYQKYDKIKRSKNKSKDKDLPVEVEISSESKQILKQLKLASLSDPHQLAVAIELSRMAFSEFKGLIRSLESKLKTKDKSIPERERDFLSDFLLHVKDGFYLLNTESFLKYWFDGVWKDKAKWSAWNGDLSKEVFSLDSQRFKVIGQQIAEEYGNVSQWARFLTRLKEQA